MNRVVASILILAVAMLGWVAPRQCASGAAETFRSTTDPAIPSAECAASCCTSSCCCQIAPSPPSLPDPAPPPPVQRIVLAMPTDSPRLVCIRPGPPAISSKIGTPRRVAARSARVMHCVWLT